MKKRLFAVILLSLFLEGTAFASAYRIPEQSADATAKAGAHTAAAVKADSTYYNPANMAWAADAWQGEIDLTYLHLTAIEYRDARSSRFDGDSDKENFLLPTLFIVSPASAIWVLSGSIGSICVSLTVLPGAMPSA